MTDTPQVEPIDDASVPEVARFLHENLNPRLSVDEWARAIVPPWPVAQPHHGFCLRVGQNLVGVYVAFFSERVVAGRVWTVCNLAAWCVLDGYGAHGLRLLRALLAMGCDVYTDLSPSGSVVTIDERLGFRRLDTTTDVRPSLPAIRVNHRVEVVTDESRIPDLISGADLEVFRSHRGAEAISNVVLLFRGQPCYVIYRRVRRKRLPLFASMVYVGDTALFGRVVGRLSGHLLVRGIPFLLAERRIVGGPVSLSRTIQGRPKLYRGAGVSPADVDDLYSEITCVRW